MIRNINIFKSYSLLLLIMLSLLTACTTSTDEPGVYNGKVDKHAQDQATRNDILQKRFTRVQTDR